MIVAPTVDIATNHPIATWFNVGGTADRFARARSIDSLRACLEIDRSLRILGDGANLLVADGGVRELVVALEGDFADVEFIDAPASTGTATPSVIVRAGAAAKLPQLITECARRGLAGIETLGGIPATVGGACVMNAGGTFGQTGDCLHTITGLDRSGEVITLKRTQIELTYRSTNFFPGNPARSREFIVTSVEFKLRRGDAEAIRKKLKDIMAAKSASQPMAEHSAGCAFKNPILQRDLPGIAVAGSKVSAGMLIDKAGCKNMRVGCATVSMQHANFFTVTPGPAARAADVLTLMRQVQDKVQTTFGLWLVPEVVVWGATPAMNPPAATTAAPASSHD